MHLYSHEISWEALKPITRRGWPIQHMYYIGMKLVTHLKRLHIVMMYHDVLPHQNKVRQCCNMLQ